MNDLFYIKYEPRLMLVDCMDLRPECELAHRRLCDWVWVQGNSPPLVPRILQEIARVAAADWPRVFRALQRKGWHGRKGRLEHAGVLRTLQGAKAAHASAADRGAKGARRRWRDSRAKAQPMAKPKHKDTDKDTDTETYTLSDSTAERSALSSAAPEQRADGENLFMSDLRETMERFDRKGAAREMAGWGGWWRNRYRENGEKARKVLSEIGGMIRERKIKRNPGAAGKDLWGRLP